MDSEYLANKKREDHKEGVKRENVCMALLEKNDNNRCEEASNFQNKFEHWDFIWKKDLKSGITIFKHVDVKGLKAGIGKGYCCMEFRTIDGRDGWLLSEYMDYLAIETDEYFMFIDRQELLDLVNKKIEEIDAIEGKKIYLDWDIKFDDLGYYRKYKRISWKDDDEVLKAPLEDFEHLIFAKLYKKDAKLIFLNYDKEISSI